ncbi:FHA domain protein [anaerobic digester metagenome]
MDLTGIIATGFSVIFILTLYFFIFRALRLMKRDVDAADRQPLTPTQVQWALEVVESGADPKLRKGTVIPLRSGMTLGRKNDNSVVLHDPYVSYHHLRFFVHEGRYVIEDLDTTNGTKLNQHRLEQKTYLRVNDLITLGSTVLRVIN